MAHGITSTDTAAYAMKPAWHGLGAVIDHAPTSDEMRYVSGLTWEPIVAPLMAASPINLASFDGVLGPWILDSPAVVKSKVAVRRSDTGAILGVVGRDSYSVIKNGDGFELLDGLSEELGSPVVYESAFSMLGGSRVVIVARMPGDDDEIVPGDNVRRYVMLQTSHDGSAAIELAPTTVRVVCANTVVAGLAEAGRNGERFRIRHTTNAKLRLADACGIIKDAIKLWDGDVALARTMAGLKLDDKKVEDFLKVVVPEAPNATKLVAQRVAEVRGDIKSRFLFGTLQNLDGIENTVWSLFNAVTEFADHGDMPYLRGAPGTRKRAESSFSRKISGSGARLKARAWVTAAAMTS